MARKKTGSRRPSLTSPGRTATGLFFFRTSERISGNEGRWGGAAAAAAGKGGFRLKQRIRGGGGGGRDGGGGAAGNDLGDLEHAGLVHEEQLERAPAGGHLLLLRHPLHVGGEELHHVAEDLRDANRSELC